MDLETAQNVARVDIDSRRIINRTVRTYERDGRYIFDRLRDNNCTIDYAGLIKLTNKQGVAESTFSQRAPALRYALARVLIDAPDCLTVDEIEELAVGIADLMKPRKGAARPRYEDRYRDGDIARRAVGPAQRHARKNRGYADWRADIVDHALERDRPLLRVQAVCGCRSDEFADGVRVTARADGALVFMINGSKCDADRIDDAGNVEAYGQRGQPWRELTLRPTGDRLFDDLYEAVEAQGGEVTYTLDDGKYAVANYGKRVCTVTKRLGYRHLSAYSLRHQFAADVKAAGVTIKPMAAAMGHRSTRSQQVYGLAKLGRRGMVHLEHSRAARPVIDHSPAESMRDQIPRRTTAQKPKSDADNGPGMR